MGNEDFYKNLYDELYGHGYHKGNEDNTRFTIENTKKIIKNYIEFESKSSDIKILDVGCSNGTFLKNIEKEDSSYNLYGIDVAEKAIMYSIDKGLSEDNIRLGSVTKIPFEDSYFDIVHSNDVLEHLKEEDRDVAIGEIYRVTKNGGYFIGKIATIEETDKNQTNSKIVDKYGIKDLHINPVESNEWIKKFNVDNKFNILSIEVDKHPRCKHKISSSVTSAKYDESNECNVRVHYQIVKK